MTITLEHMYDLTGLMLVIFSLYTLTDRQHKAKYGTALFWMIYAVTFLFGKLLPAWLIGLLVVLIGLGLWVLQVPLALVIGVVTFFASFIPVIGAVTAGALAVMIALVSDGLTKALLALALIIIVQQVEGNVLQPMLQSCHQLYHVT